jgi:TonB family protein
LGDGFAPFAVYMTPTKESVETGNSVADAVGPQPKSRPKAESAHLRADAVSLEIPIKAHGSLLPAAGAGASVQAQPFEEQTTTMIVFPQGGVLKMSTAVSAGQVMVLTNLKSRQDAICRVIKVRAFAKAQSYVEIEFTSPQPGYWGVYFPTDGPEVARTPAPPPAPAESAAATATEPQPPAPQATPTPVSPAQNVAAPASIPVEQKLPEISRPSASAPPPPPASMAVETAAPAEISQPPVMPSRPLAPPKLPESSFVSIGAKEDVLAPADSTRAPRPISSPNSALRPEQDADSDIGRAIDALIAPSTRPVPSAPQRAEAVDSALGIRANETPARVESFAKSLPVQSGAGESGRTAPKQMFGMMLDSNSAASVSFQSSRRSTRAWIQISIAAVLIAGAAGAYYLHLGPFATGTSRASAAPVSAAAAQPAVSQPVAQEASPMPGTTDQAPDSSTATMPSEAASADSAAIDSRKETAAPETVNNSRNLNEYLQRRDVSGSQAQIKSSDSAASHPNVVAPRTFAVSNSRPIVRAGANVNSVGAAPVLNPGASPSISNGSLPALAPPAPNLPAPPKPAPTAPVRVGGKILPPRLVSSVLPMYPPIAQQAGVSGTVVIDTTIDKNGNVAKTRVISGPELLRNAALSALRQWKYEPSRLNGQPISVEMIVSIRFH